MPSTMPLAEHQRAELRRAAETIDAIDTLGTKDWQHLRPDEHAKGLPDSAGGLNRIIVSKPVDNLVKRRADAARGASRAQARARLSFQILVLLVGMATALAMWNAIAYI